ncbi:hypothetical protein K402DRAFT_389529 [Aulographum hederae CBS 113979]|uniref:Extracellular membrane protein CFEM domain-containing protein n=1 Tax=Aulographum hederae CBS 113979 TaxID=1176131 RepID=A0A6G1HBL2_9PEZI|nr:hypothetical protein K402DRAFT_389529 [Aulographum hederae CBS 113979]
MRPMKWFGPIRLSSAIRVLLCVTSLIAPCIADPQASVTIDHFDGYGYQRQCGKGCLQNNYDGGEDLEGELGCTWNGCYCGTQYGSVATSFISGCWPRNCGDDSNEGAGLDYDISTALFLYNAYCGENVWGAGGASTTTVTVTGEETTDAAVQTTVDSNAAPSAGGAAAGSVSPNTDSPQQDSPRSTVTGHVYIVSTSLTTIYTRSSSSNPIPTQSGSSSTGGGAKFSTSDKIALGVGLGLGIPTLIVTAFMCFLNIARS